MDKPRVFISYAHKDTPLVDNVRARLQEAGYQIWIDREGIAGGQPWAEKVPKAIMGCRYFILMISTSSIRSKNVWKEIIFAEKKRLKFLPVLLASVRLPSKWDFILADTNYIDLAANQANGIRQLIHSLEQLTKESGEESEEDQSRPTDILRTPVSVPPLARNLFTPIGGLRSRNLVVGSGGALLGGARAPAGAGRVTPHKTTTAPPVSREPAINWFVDARFWLLAAATIVLSAVLAVLSGWAASLIPDSFPILPESGFFPWVALLIAGLVWGLAVVFRGVIEVPENMWEVVKNTLLYPVGLADSTLSLSQPILLCPPLNWVGSLGLALLGSWLTRQAFGWEGSAVFYILFGLLFLVQLAWFFMEEISLYACAMVIIACGWCGVLIDGIAGIITRNLQLQVSPPVSQLPALVAAGLAWGLVYCVVGMDFSTDWYDPLVRLFEPYGHLISSVWLFGAMPFNLFFAWALARGVLEAIARFTTWQLDPDLWVYIVFGVFTVSGMLIYRGAQEDL